MNEWMNDVSWGNLRLLRTLDIPVSSFKSNIVSKGIVSLGVKLSRCVCVRRGVYHVSTARRISLVGEGNALYPVLSTYLPRCLASAKVLCRSESVTLCVCPPSRGEGIALRLECFCSLLLL